MKEYRYIKLIVDGKKVFDKRCDKIKVDCLANTIQCLKKGEGCKGCENCQDQRELAGELCNIAHDYAWFGGGDYDWQTSNVRG